MFQAMTKPAAAESGVQPPSSSLPSSALANAPFPSPAKTVSKSADELPLHDKPSSDDNASNFQPSESEDDDSIEITRENIRVKSRPVLAAKHTGETRWFPKQEPESERVIKQEPHPLKSEPSNPQRKQKWPLPTPVKMENKASATWNKPISQPKLAAPKKIGPPKSSRAAGCTANVPEMVVKAMENMESQKLVDLYK